MDNQTLAKNFTHLSVCRERPLRERCKNTLTIQCSPNSEVSDVIATGREQYSPDDPGVWQRDETPSSQNASPGSADDKQGISEDLPECVEWGFVRIAENGFHPNPPCYCPEPWSYQRQLVPRHVLEPAFGLRRLQLIVPGLYVAIVPEDRYQTICHTNIIRPDVEFTHHVNVVTGLDLPPESRFPRIGITRETRCHICETARLQLCVRKADSRRFPVCRLDPTQLAFARDFLSLALSHPQCPDGPFGKDTRVLVTTSPDSPIDAMAIVVCHLAYASRYRVPDIARYINGEDTIHFSWLGLLNRRETTELIEQGVVLE